MNARRVYIHACGGIGPDGRIWQDDAVGTLQQADAAPIALKSLLKARSIVVPRVASRFAELAALGAHACLQRLHAPLDAATRLYLASGLGDVARTDALYYQVMPPRSEVASPAHFATSGNNMAGFFVAQYAGLRARNLTICADSLSLEQALLRACSDLRHLAAPCAFVGSVDETTVPREFYVRRFALREHEHIGEASGWFVLRTASEGAIGELLDVRVWPTRSGALEDASVMQIADRIIDAVPASSLQNATLLAGCRLASFDARRLAQRAGVTLAPDYLSRTGMFPTAISLAMIDVLNAPGATTIIHVNRDDAGRTGMVVLRAYGVRASRR